MSVSHTQDESVSDFQYPTPAVAAVTRRPGRTNRTQFKLFQAALEIMSQKGAEATTVEEVALKAGVSKGTVYYNFGSKKTMIEQLLQYGAQLLKTRVQQGSQKSDPREAMRAGIKEAFEYLAEHPGFARLWITEIWRSKEPWSEAIVKTRQDLVSELENMVRAIGTRYPVDHAQDPEAVSISIFGSIFMLAMDREIHAAERTSEDATRAVMLTVDSYIAH